MEIAGENCPEYADRISQHQPTDSAVPTQTPETPLQGILGPQRHCNSQEHRKYQGQTQQLKELHITPTYCLQLISVVQQEFFCASVGLSHQHFCFLEDNKKRDLYCKWTNKEERPSHSSTSPSPIVCPQFHNYAPPSAPSPSCSSYTKHFSPSPKVIFVPPTSQKLSRVLSTKEPGLQFSHCSAQNRLYFTTTHCSSRQRSAAGLDSQLYVTLLLMPH